MRKINWDVRPLLKGESVSETMKTKWFVWVRGDCLSDDHEEERNMYMFDHYVLMVFDSEEDAQSILKNDKIALDEPLDELLHRQWDTNHSFDTWEVERQGVWCDMKYPLIFQECVVFVYFSQDTDTNE